MACKIQTCYRGYRLVIIFHYIITFFITISPPINFLLHAIIFFALRCRKLLLLLRQKKQEYEDTIEKLQREVSYE